MLSLVTLETSVASNCEVTVTPKCDFFFLASICAVLENWVKIAFSHDKRWNGISARWPRHTQAYVHLLMMLGFSFLTDCAAKEKVD